jgi:thiamine biosynthesis protein ThiC
VVLEIAELTLRSTNSKALPVLVAVTALAKPAELTSEREKKWKGGKLLSIDPAKARAYRASLPPADQELCSMCGEFCAIKRSRSVQAAAQQPAAPGHR